jgi:hypothetical protein
VLSQQVRDIMQAHCKINHPLSAVKDSRITGFAKLGFVRNWGIIIPYAWAYPISPVHNLKGNNENMRPMNYLHCRKHLQEFGHYLKKC